MTTTEPRRARLATILGLREGAQRRSHEVLTTLHKIAMKSGLYDGHRRVYRSDQADSEGNAPLGEQKPPDLKKVELVAEQLLNDMAGAVTRFYDLQLTMDVADTQAFADVIITNPDGSTETLLRNVPVTTLMFLEKRLSTDIQTFVRKLPLLDPSKDWTIMPGQTRGMYQTAQEETISTAKVKQTLEAAPATKEHRAQVVVWDADVRAGVWARTNYSGALTPERYAAILQRLDLLLDAIKSARERANRVEVEDRECGNALMNFILNG